MADYVGTKTEIDREYRRAGSLDQAYILARRLPESAPGLVWIEGDDPATNPPRAFNSVAHMFPLSDSERDHIDRVPFINDPEHWKDFATRMREPLLECYVTRDMDLEAALRTMRGFALGCETGHRVLLLGLLAEAALTAKRMQRKR